MELNFFLCVCASDHIGGQLHPNCTTCFIFGGSRSAKEVLQNSTPICTTAPWSWQLHRVLELGVLSCMHQPVQPKSLS
jgi:hypothetical protein